MPLFLSTVTNKVDKKGRVSVPASFRSAVAADGKGGEVNNSVVIYPSLFRTCLDGTNREYMQDISDSIYDEFGPFSEEGHELSDLLLGSAHELSWDPEGRILLPEPLIAHAGLSEAATFVGRGELFQIWQPDAYQDFHASKMDRAREQARKLRPGKSRRNDHGGGQQ